MAYMKSKYICIRPIREIVILADGRITSCCLDPKGKNSFANIYEDDFKNTIGKFQNFKKKMVDNFENFPVCLRCVKERKNYYNFFHKLNPSEEEIESFLSVESFPKQLVIELTVICNMLCSSCISGRKKIKEYRKTENGFYLDINKLSDWMSQYIKELKTIRLFNYGETFLHPKAIEFCHFLTNSNPGINLIIATNLLPLNNEDRMRKLILTQPNVLYVSLHGATQESVCKYMGSKADFHGAINLMNKLITLRNEMKLDAPLIVWKYILFKWNDSEKEISLAKSLSKQFGIDYLGFEITNGDIASEKFYKDSKEFADLQKSEYFMQNIYQFINNKKIERKRSF